MTTKPAFSTCGSACSPAPEPITAASPAIASIPGGLINGERSFILSVRIEKHVAAAHGSQRLMRGVE
jgi:hypothetical protein